MNGNMQDMFSAASNFGSDVVGNRFVQYIHEPTFKLHCLLCLANSNRIFDDNLQKPKVGDENHPNCHCYYRDVKKKRVGTISKLGFDGPDVWLKAYGTLPDYYITKWEAITKFGWNNSRNTIAGKAPGKMIGGDVYYNLFKLLPVAPGRVWYECDVDYERGGRSKLRLFYSNDGLMFFSDDHGKKNFYFVE